MTKTFLLGVGAQKAGTTWIYRYLDSCPEADMGFGKEYHVWDIPDVPGCRHFLTSPEQAMQSSNKAFHRRIQTSHKAYFTYFAGLVQQPGIAVTGDITPSYAGLSVERLRSIRDRIEAHGMQCKFVFMMRDPVERCWSAVRMFRRFAEQAGKQVATTEADDLRSYYASPAARLRTEYHQTIERLEAVADPQDIYLGIFETMTQRTEIERFAAFLGLPPRIGLAAMRPNSSPKKGGIPRELATEIAWTYRPVYDYCADRFPETTALWSGRPLL